MSLAVAPKRAVRDSGLLGFSKDSLVGLEQQKPNLTCVACCMMQQHSQGHDLHPFNVITNVNMVFGFHILNCNLTLFVVSDKALELYLSP